MSLILQLIKEKFGTDIVDKEDLQTIRLEVEKAKITLTNNPTAYLKMNLKEVGKFEYKVCFR